MMPLKKLIGLLRTGKTELVDALKERYDKDMEYIETVVRSCDDPVCLLTAIWWANDTVTRYKDFETARNPKACAKVIEKYMELHRDIIGQAYKQMVGKTICKVVKKGTQKPEKNIE